MMMDEILGSKDPSTDHPDQTENDADQRTESPSPERQASCSGNPVSPGLPETHRDARPRNSSDESIENDARPTPGSEANSDNGDSEALGNQFTVFQSVNELTYESSFSCKYPGCTFTSVDAEVYLKHEDSHVDGGSVSCDICKVIFPTYASMRRHHLYIHQGIRTFECSQCSKRFLRKDQFLDHQQNHSSMPRPFQCAFCGLCFNLCNQLQSHLNSFHGFHRTCVFCQFIASSPNALKVHYSTFHQDLASRAPVNATESGAIDLATVSQNFSILSASNFSAATGSESNANPGPSDFSQASKGLRLLSPLHSTRNLSSEAVKPSARLVEDPSHTCVSSASGSTISTFMTSQGFSSKSAAVATRGRIQIKPEPPDIVVEDSQSSSVQPTSTMDLSTSDIVESTCMTSEAGTSTPCRLKVHKHSSTDDTGSESQYSPPSRHCIASQVPAQSTIRTPHTCCRLRPYDDSNSSRRCREHSRHTCASHKHGSEKRMRYSDSDIDRSAQNDQSDGEERKVFYNQATSTNSSTLRETQLPRGNLVSTLTATEGPSESQHESNYYNHKNTIVIHGIESCALTCVYCGIVFPDQTLYLLHRSLHSEASPWKCNLCGKTCKDKYDFNSHVISKGHH